ncbi:MAG: RluA family pseudouridine synthase [Solibacillus sp.]
MKKQFELQFRATREQLLREAIAEWGISKRALTAIKFDGGDILVNGAEQNVRYVLAAGDEVTIRFPREQVSDGLVAEDEDLQIVYEDEAILVINKPAYQSTIPSREHPTGSVANVLCGYFERQQIASTAHIVTRLDRDTSGLMIIAKHRHIHHLMSEQQQRGEVHREYEAIVHGHAETQSIMAPIGRKDTSIIEREVRADGQFAHTDVRVVAHRDGYSHIRLKLHTGRTHQIRVHMSYVGHPLVGDDLYGGSTEQLARQALHCVFVEFTHPISGECMRFTSELPMDMHQLIVQD